MNPSCVTVYFFIGDTLGGLPGFLCSSVSTGTSLGATLDGLPGLFDVFGPLELVPDVSVDFWGIDALLLHGLVMVPFTPHTAVYYEC